MYPYIRTLMYIRTPAGGVRAAPGAHPEFGELAVRGSRRLGHRLPATQPHVSRRQRLGHTVRKSASLLLVPVNNNAVLLRYVMLCAVM